MLRALPIVIVLSALDPRALAHRPPLERAVLYADASPPPPPPPRRPNTDRERARRRRQDAARAAKRAAR